MNICSSVGTLSLSRPFFLYYTISIYRKRKHSFPHILYLLPRTFVYLYISLLYIYSIYREEHTFPQLFTLFRHSLPLSHTSIILLLYIEEKTFSPPPFSPYICSYKVNTFSTAHFLTLIVLGKSLREKVFENFISIVL